MNGEKIEAGGTMKAGDSGGRVRPRWKHWHLKSSMVLTILGAIAIIVYFLRSELGKEYEGVGAALCVVACGGFLVWHVIHLFAEQDALEERLINVKKATVSSGQSNPAGKETKPPTLPEAEQNFEY